MGLYLRLLGNDPNNPRIPIHGFQSIVAEWARGNITTQQAQDGIAHISGAPLTAAEQTEANTLRLTVPTGTTTANKADRALRLLEIDQVLLLVDHEVAPYNTETAIKTRLGV